MVVLALSIFRAMLWAFFSITSCFTDFVYQVPFQLTVAELNAALEWMHSNKRYRQLVFYLEACESGSMFYKTLKQDINGLFNELVRQDVPEEWRLHLLRFAPISRIFIR